MELVLIRDTQTDRVTLGKLYCEELELETLEDIHRDVKVKGETRIPAGTYRLQLRYDSPMAARYRERFGQGHKGMMWLQDVPDFEYVYIHVGNDEDDTDGCILLGRSRGVDEVWHSVAAYRDLYPRVIAAIERGEPVTITIHDDATA